MKLIILAAGQGQRMHLLAEQPKATLPIAKDKKLLEITLEQAKLSDVFSEIVLCVGYMKDAALQAYEDSVTSWVHMPFYGYQTVGTWYIAMLKGILDDEDFIIINGDLLIAASAWPQIIQDGKPGIRKVVREDGFGGIFGVFGYKARLLFRGAVEYFINDERGAVKTGTKFFDWVTKTREDVEIDDVWLEEGLVYEVDTPGDLHEVQEAFKKGVPLLWRKQ